MFISFYGKLHNKFHDVVGMDLHVIRVNISVGCVSHIFIMGRAIYHDKIVSPMAYLIRDKEFSLVDPGVFVRFA